MKTLVTEAAIIKKIENTMLIAKENQEVKLRLDLSTISIVWWIDWELKDLRTNFVLAAPNFCDYFSFLNVKDVSKWKRKQRWSNHK